MVLRNSRFDFDSGPKQATFFYIRLPCLPSEIGASDIVLVSSNGCLTSDTRGLGHGIQLHDKHG